MKFGKRLQAQKEEHPSWVYIDYSGLKKQLKRMEKFGRNTTLLSKQAFSERDAFVDLLFNDINNIDSFYLLLENQFSTSFSRLLSEVRLLLNTKSTVTMDDKPIMEFIEFCQQLDALRKYVVWNYVGVLKILKKCAKRTAFDVRELVVGTLTSKGFYKTSIPATLYTEAQCLAAQLQFSVEGLQPKREDYTCPICLDILQNPVVLSCAHRFCWTCIGQASQHQMSACPICRKEQQLDPASYHVDPVLERFVNANFKPSIVGHQGAQKQNTLLIDLAEKIREETEDRIKSTAPVTAPTVYQTPSPPVLDSTSDSEYVLRLPPDVTHQEIIFDNHTNGKRSWSVRFEYWGIAALMISMIIFGMTIRAGYEAVHPNYREEYHNLLVRFETHFGKHDNSLYPVLPFLPDTIFIGHVNNDVDSVCSAIAAAHLYNGKPALSGPINTETEFVLKKFNLPLPALGTHPNFKDKNWCLVDHNSHDKIPRGVDAEKIVCVIDHHQLQEDAISTSVPRSIEIEPFGSTTTMLFWKYVQYGLTVPQDVAGCLLSGVLSDTLNLTSPTTTETDKRAAKELQSLAKVTDIPQFVIEMFEAKSNLDLVPVASIVDMDFKTFTIALKRVGIAVTETVSPQSIWKRKGEIEEEVRRKKESHKLDYMLYMVVNILELQTEVLAIGDEEYELIRGAYKGKIVSDEHVDILSVGRLVSRKKQFVPMIEQYLKEQSL